MAYISFTLVKHPIFLKLRPVEYRESSIFRKIHFVLKLKQMKKSNNLSTRMQSVFHAKVFENRTIKMRAMKSVITRISGPTRKWNYSNHLEHFPLTEIGLFDILSDLGTIHYRHDSKSNAWVCSYSLCFGRSNRYSKIDTSSWQHFAKTLSSKACVMLLAISIDLQRLSTRISDKSLYANWKQNRHWCAEWDQTIHTVSHRFRLYLYTWTNTVVFDDGYKRLS